MKIIQNRESYIEWDDYIKLIKKREIVNFISKTALESYKNLLSKEVE